jgi:hypothetical protein
MPPAITRHFLIPGGSQPLSRDQNQANRRHPQRLASGYDDAIAPRKGRDTMIPGGLAPGAIDDAPVGPHTWAFPRNAVVKVVGFNADGPIGSNIGTSAEGVLCATDGMSVCCAVVLGGNPPSPPSDATAGACLDGMSTTSTDPAAKVRVFHAFPFNTDAPRQVSEAIVKMWNGGLEVSAAMRGGMRGEAEPEKMVRAMKRVLADHSVPLVCDRTLEIDKENWRNLGPLGGIVKGNRSHFVDDVRLLPDRYPQEE